jgi:hypothetical protein
MRTQRQVVDYSLQKRALLREVYSGRVATFEVCDASPYLLSAARFHGEPTEDRCPVCRRENVTLVHYIYGDELKQSAGQARSRVELPVLAMSFREIQVYVVEVCRACGWNHLVEQFLLGGCERFGPVQGVRHAPIALGAGGHGVTMVGPPRPSPVTAAVCVRGVPIFPFKDNFRQSSGAAATRLLNQQLAIVGSRSARRASPQPGSISPAVRWAAVLTGKV